MPRRIPRDLVSLDEAGSVLDVSKWTVRRMISRGELAGYKVGRAPNSPIRVSESEVRRMARQIPAASDHTL